MLFNQLNLNETQTAFLMAIRDVGMAVCVNTFENSDLDVLEDFKRYMDEENSLKLVGLVELYKNKTFTPDDLLLSFAPLTQSIEEKENIPEDLFENLKEGLANITFEDEVHDYYDILISLSKTGKIFASQIHDKVNELGYILETINEFDLLDMLHCYLLEYTGTVEEDKKIDDIIITLCACLSRYEV